MSDSYQTFTRKYRPQKFFEMIGQEAIVTTLKNAIRLKRTAHAYLFSGSRGVGKTTLARILAKALNCPHLDAQTEPCNECTSCQEITASRSMDVIEIDGASNRGIDDIRQINETITYAPAHGYKIYIIDEVHMLTKEAFNALLKTLEEPPPSVKFFFATTEAHKVLPTIISRCQRFDLPQIDHQKIVEKLRSIANECARDIEEEALHLIARFSEGSLRDAESFLDQIFCFEEGRICANMLHQTLGATPYEYFFALDTAIRERRLSFAFSCIDSLVQSGKDLFYFAEELIEHFRRLLLIKLDQSSLIPLSDDLKKEYQKIALHWTSEELLSILETLFSSLQTMQKSVFKRATLEFLLLEILQSKERISLPTLVRRLVELEKGLSSSGKEVYKKEESLPCQPPSSSTDPILEKIPFSFSKEEAISDSKVVEQATIPSMSPPTENTMVQVIHQEKNISSKPKSHHDTVMRFASIELEGSLEIDSSRRN